MTPNEYLERIKRIVDGLDRDALQSAADKLMWAMKNKRSIFVAGNGGSAATANHFAADFGKNIITSNVGRPKIMSLCTNIASVTAYANDEGYENAFCRQMTNWAEPGDVLVVISASGNSPSVVSAAKLMRELGGTVIAMTGFSGGALRELADISLHTDDCHYESVEDIHSVFCHLLVSCIKEQYTG